MVVVVVIVVMTSAVDVLCVLVAFFVFIVMYPMGESCYSTCHSFCGFQPLTSIKVKTRTIF